MKVYDAFTATLTIDRALPVGKYFHIKAKTWITKTTKDSRHLSQVNAPILE